MKIRKNMFRRDENPKYKVGHSYLQVEYFRQLG